MPSSGANAADASPITEAGSTRRSGVAAINFTRDDFEVFGIPTFPERMQALKARIRPKLMSLAEQLQPTLNDMANSTLIPHVAKHARRTVNPPPETWVAFGPSPRGYKRFGHFGLVVSRGGLHARVVVTDEAENRPQMAKVLMDRAEALAKLLCGHKVARYDRWDYMGIPELVEPTVDFWQGVTEALAKKTGGLDIGVGWPVDRAMQLTNEELRAAFKALLPLYEITRA